MFRIGIDVGGTFTDVTLLDANTGKYYTYKLSSTLQDQSVAIADGTKETLELYGVPVEEIEYFGHGTTVATNMIIERKGAKTALITTKGFRDLLEIGRQVRPSLYNIFEDKPETLIRRALRKEANERVMSDGTILKEIRNDEIREIVKEMKAQKVESVAVCFLFSFLNPQNERAVEEIIREEWPEAYISISSTILPEFREFERLSTTVINSYLGPRIKMYINNLQKRIKGIGIAVEPYITQSNGGVMSISSTVETPVQTALSGPSAGVMGAIYVAEKAGYKNIITYDMGGTSTDVSLVNDGIAEYTTKRKVCGLPSGVPMIDVHAVGAGGGSIAYIDNAGALKVGPESAGANPGPAAYGLGNEQPVVTDANLVLGRINPEYVLGGRLKINAALSEAAVEEKLAKAMKMTPEQAAQGVISVVNSNMARAIRVITVEKGYNPSDFILAAYGGAGPLHAVELAQEMGIGTVLIPPAPGALCALGLLTADIKKSYVKTALLAWEEATPQKVNELVKGLMEQGKEWLASEHVQEERQKFHNIAEMRYVGQNYELQIEIPAAEITKVDIEKMKKDFFLAHEMNYGYYNPEAPVQFVNFRSEAIGLVTKPELSELEYEMSDPGTAVISRRNVYFEKTGTIECPVYGREKLGKCARVEGPCIIEQMDSTTVIPPDTWFKVDKYGNLIVKVFV
ncbi:hydantoinase/oxoprolinase family protein [[Clostridium] symbiosum]|uniref:hydantoinase/oxoprolinase family protein n=1 Tax=Clostridium symbiosum TaxID=1512 RepID=UPI001D096558|nr:hydantoinase/oxoprolinase family protein [[Clostridium] symbiosum]MCB6610703.1 hydantoinase/oxoprolinase family protein [[Clostridium] symbiosum]MCB6931313.1 hydantoinase/oxoprolinase family protein [[Clostridium] symbiosum]